jgi:hypothetical protein
MQTQTNATPVSSTQLPAIAAVVIHEVSDYATWKSAFDTHAEARKKAGIFTAHVNRDIDNPNLITLYLGARTAEGLKAFSASPDLKETMQRAGVIGAPHIALITPVEDETVKDRSLPGAIVRHEVADFKTWKKAFDEHAVARGAAGIVGHAVNRSVEQPNLVVTYLQAESLEKLREFAASPNLKETMQKAGVQGQPAISFVTGQEWTN